VWPHTSHPGAVRAGVRLLEELRRQLLRPPHVMDHQLPLVVVCRVLGVPRSTVYARRVRTDPLVRPGPATLFSDADLLGLIRQVLVASPFAGEGSRKVRARLRREHQVQVSGKRVLRLLRQEGLLAPQRVPGPPQASAP
jgi:HTH-like domain